MKISIHKKYQTRDGRPVEIIATNAQGKRPVIGFIGDDVSFTFWNSKGANDPHRRACGRDLVEVTPKRVMWLNVYPDDEVHAHESREDADGCSADDRRIARLKIEFEEGQFDE